MCNCWTRNQILHTHPEISGCELHHKWFYPKIIEAEIVWWRHHDVWSPSLSMHDHTIKSYQDLMRSDQVISYKKCDFCLKSVKRKWCDDVIMISGIMAIDVWSVLWSFIKIGWEMIELSVETCYFRAKPVNREGCDHTIMTSGVYLFYLWSIKLSLIRIGWEITKL